MYTKSTYDFVLYKEKRVIIELMKTHTTLRPLLNIYFTND